jgi:hypothetical protein
LVLIITIEQYGFGHSSGPSLNYDRIRTGVDQRTLLAQAADTTVPYLRYLNPHSDQSTPPVPYIVNVPAGKANDVVALFRRIPASKVINTNLANSSAGESWQNISNRTGVTVNELMAANPGKVTGRQGICPPGNKHVRRINRS